MANQMVTGEALETTKEGQDRLTHTEETEAEDPEAKADITAKRESHQEMENATIVAYTAIS